jgi:hypothetical protein
MSVKRDIIAEIDRRRTRHHIRVPRYNQTKRRLDALVGAYQYVAPKTSGIPLEFRKELHRYFPIALVAITEGHFKSLYRDLIDSGDPYLRNATSLKYVRFDFASAAAMANRGVTLGEIVAQQLPHNNLTDIEANMSALLNEDFGQTFRDRILREDATQSQTTFQRWMRRIIDSIFEVRHIYCHELATKRPPLIHEGRMCISIVRVFLQMVEEHLIEHRRRKA